MAKIVRMAGAHKDTALVSIGWSAFVLGTLTPDPFVKVVLMAMARVLPKALYMTIFNDANLRKNYAPCHCSNH